jgi:L,D-transpeptidase YcbB
MLSAKNCKITFQKASFQPKRNCVSTATVDAIFLGLKRMLTTGRIAQLAIVMTGLALPALAQETVIRCETVLEDNLIRHVCGQKTISSDFKVELPETIPPITTGNGADLNSASGLSLDPPELPPTRIVIAPKDLVAPTESVVSTAIIAPPASAVVPQAVIAQPLPEPFIVTPIVVAPVVNPPAATAIPTIPQEFVKTAVQRLTASKRMSKTDADAVAAFYEARQLQPLWIDKGQWNERALSVRAQLAAAAEDGMDPARYRSVSAFHSPGEAQWAAYATAEIQLTEAVLLYAREATIGRVAPRLVHPLLTSNLKVPTVDAIMTNLAESTDTGATLKSFQPPHTGYQNLRQKLAELRAEQPAASVEYFPDGPPLRVGMRDSRVPLIREKLGMGYDSTVVYDRLVSIKVAGLQKAAGLPITGAFTAQTRRVLTGEAPSAAEAEIVANMERWRWLPRELGQDHVAVNVPQLKLQLIRKGQAVHEARVIVGTGETQTPIFSDMIDHIVVNPSWYVPPGVLKKDPRYLDPIWAEARGYTLTKRGEHVTVRVPPSASNALGYVKFMFPNEHAVYLHDTPKRGLFGATNRTLSNGCVRVENPFQLAALMFESEGWTEQRFKKMIGSSERMMKLSKKLPVHLTYFTLTVEPDGTLAKHPDLYGHSARLRQLLGAS